MAYYVHVWTRPQTQTAQPASLLLRDNNDGGKWDGAKASWVRPFETGRAHTVWPDYRLTVLSCTFLQRGSRMAVRATSLD